MPVGYYDQPHCRGNVNTEAVEVLQGRRLARFIDA